MTDVLYVIVSCQTYFLEQPSILKKREGDIHRTQKYYLPIGCVELNCLSSSRRYVEVVQIGNAVKDNHTFQEKGSASPREKWLFAFQKRSESKTIIQLEQTH